MCDEVLGNGLDDAGHHEDALSVKEAELSMGGALAHQKKICSPCRAILRCTYTEMGRLEEALKMQKDVYSRRLKLNGEEHVQTLISAMNYATSLASLERYQEAKSLLRKTMPVARRVLGDEDRLTLR